MDKDPKTMEPADWLRYLAGELSDKGNVQCGENLRWAAARIQQLEARNAELEALLAHAQKEANDATDIMQETSLEAGEKLATMEAAISLLDKGYETGLNPDLEDERIHAIFRVSGGVNDREYELVSVGETVLEALLALTAGEVD